MCTLEARWSVVVEVTDQAGTPIQDATAVYSVDGEPAVACTTLGNELLCGAEVDGGFEITVSARGYMPALVSAEVDDGRCHVEGQHVNLALEPTS